MHKAYYTARKLLNTSAGENCSTAEVESIISTISGLKGTTVFGVEVPGTDGRAGMAVMSDPENSLDLHQLAIGVIKSLPSYARPLFLRILTTEIEMTGNGLFDTFGLSN